MGCEEKIKNLLSIIEKVANKEYEKDNWKSVLDGVAELFEADGAVIGEIRDQYIYYTKLSSGMLDIVIGNEENLRVPVLWSAFAEALDKGYFIVNDYQSYSKAVSGWKDIGLKSMMVAILGTREPFGSLAVGRIHSQKPFKEEDGKVLKNLAFIFSLIVKEEMEKRKLLEKAIKDHLTQLYNRFYLEETATRELERAKRYGFPVSLVLFDLDNFKEVNDRYGHQAGDMVLIKFAEVLRSSIRTSDVPVRYGGEEFVLLFPHTSEEEAVAVAERIRQRFEAVTFNFNGEKVSLTVSAGVSSCEGGTCTLNELLEQADKAMYRAKRSGKNRVETFSYKLS